MPLGIPSSRPAATGPTSSVSLMAACFSAVVYFRGDFIGGVLLRESHSDLFGVSAQLRMDTVRQEHLPDQPAPVGLVTGYDHDLIPVAIGRTVKPDHTSWASLAWASGGGASTAADLAAIFLRLVEDPDALSTDARDALFSPTTWPQGTDDNDHWIDVGRGLFRMQLGARTVWAHEGLFVGAEALVAWDPADGAVVALIGNRSRFFAHEVAGRLMDEIDAAPKRDRGELGWNAQKLGSSANCAASSS